MKKLLLLISLVLSTLLGLNAQEYHLGQVVTNPDGSQGVVFYLNEDGTAGWMVALHDASTQCSWGPSGPIDGLNNIQPVNSDFLTTVFLDHDGYEHTQMIRTYCESIGYNTPYAAGLVDIDNGWYLPSAGQLKWLYVNAIFYEPALQSVGDVMGLYTYWSSSVRTDEKAWGVMFGAPYSMEHWAWNACFTGINRGDYFDSSSRGYAVRAIRDLDFSPLPIIGLLQTPANICDEGPLELATPPLSNTDSFGWEIAQDESFTDPVAYTGQSLDSNYNGWYLRLWATNEEGTKFSNTVQISVFESTESLTKISVCEPYTWNDSTYTESGIYQKAYTSIHGCDSIATLQLHVGNGPELSEIQGPEGIYYHVNELQTYSIDSVPDAFGYEWRIDNANWPLSYEPDAPQCNVGVYTKGTATLTVRVYDKCGFSEKSILIHHDLEPGIKIYPNPNNGKFNIQLFGIEGRTLIEVHDYLGQLIDRFEVQSILNGLTVPYSLSGKAAGVYVVTITNGYEHYYKKVVKESSSSFGMIHY